MEYTKTITIEAGDVIDVMTEDGWETATVVSLDGDKIFVHIDLYDTTRVVGIDDVKI